jgi:hypothetical protein
MVLSGSYYAQSQHVQTPFLLPDGTDGTDRIDGIDLQDKTVHPHPDPLPSREREIKE